MLRIAPRLPRDLSANPTPLDIAEAIVDAVSRTQRHIGSPTPVPLVVVVPEALFLGMAYMPHPGFLETDQDLLSWLTSRYKAIGLHAIVSGDDDELAEAEADAALIRMMGPADKVRVLARGIEAIMAAASDRIGDPSGWEVHGPYDWDRFDENDHRQCWEIKQRREDGTVGMFRVLRPTDHDGTPEDGERIIAAARAGVDLARAVLLQRPE